MTNINDIYKVLTELNNTSSTKSKKDILKQNNNEFFIRYLKYVFDRQNFIYNKAKIPKVEIGDLDDDQTLEKFFELLDKLNSKELRGKKSDDAIIEYLQNKKKEYHDLFIWAIKRRLPSKLGEKLINEAYQKIIIPFEPYMRCESPKYLEKRIKYPALIQTKADGLFCNFKYKDGVEVTTREGKKIPLLENSIFILLKKVLQENIQNEEFVLSGELLMLNDQQEILPREIGNGLINKYIKFNDTLETLNEKYINAKTKTSKSKISKKIDALINEVHDIKDKMVYVVWDWIPYQDFYNLASPKTAKERFWKTKEIFILWKENGPQEHSKRFQIINSEIVNSYDEAIQFYNKQLKLGLEGAVIKNLDSKWVDDTNTTGLVKMKEFKEADLIIKGWKPGKAHTEFQEGIGALLCESSCGKLKVEVSGLTHEQRGLRRVSQEDSSKGLEAIPGFDPNQYIGKVAAVKFNSVIKSKDNDFYSLFLPSLVEIRDPADKSTADDLDKILNL